jgi:predicted DNA-binding protein YlxM (UPF0122 family)
MGNFQYHGIVKEQIFTEEFNWNNKLFYSYIISFNEYKGYFRIVRQSTHNQDLVGSRMLFNYDNELEKISSYRIMGNDKQKDKKEQIKNKFKEIINNLKYENNNIFNRTSQK